MIRHTKYITDFAGDGPTIVLLHGFLTASKYWARLQPKLTRAGYRVVTIDLLGFGAAPKPQNSDYAYDDHLEHIEAALAKVNIDKPFILVGHSMGALLAVQYSNRYSDKVESLILLHPPLYLNPTQAWRALRYGLGRLSPAYRFLLDSRYRRVAWEVVRWLRVSIMSNHSHVARERSLVNIIESATVFDELKRVDKKTLLLVGLKDRAIYRENLSKQQGLAESVRVEIENVDHNSPYRRPSLVYRHIVRFTT